MIAIITITITDPVDVSLTDCLKLLYESLPLCKIDLLESFLGSIPNIFLLEIILDGCLFDIYLLLSIILI